VEAVVLCGVQASGKTTFYVERFLHTHVRISLDLLGTRHREQLLLRACLEGGQRFVVDKVNHTAAERHRYVEPARAAGFRVVGFVFEVPAAEALARNAARPPERRVPAKGLLGTFKRLEVPSLEEGFDALWRVRAAPSRGFIVEEIRRP
jgi:predicted kinase